MAAIARVFENQGRYGQAEVMYRKALKQNPNDPTIRTQLQQLAERRKGKNFAADPVKEAIAQADSAASARTHSSAAAVAPQPKALAKVGISSGTNIGTTTGVAQALPGFKTTKPTPNAPAAIVSSVLTQPSSELAEEIEAGATSAVTTAAATVNSTINHVKAVSAEMVSPAPELRANTVTAEEILAVVDTSAEHSDLLLRGLRSWEIVIPTMRRSARHSKSQVIRQKTLTCDLRSLIPEFRETSTTRPPLRVLSA
jgi:hypothetical protein